jgi:pyruvate-ferredoxin/flavodoxin oxidoreductase
MNAKYPGIPTVINGNGAVAEVMGHVCCGVIGYPITPSTEISEIYEAFRAGGGCNVWGKHPFFFEPEGEHSAQSGALGAALTGGKYVSNASSSQGILYGLESHYVTVGKKVGGFVLHVAARVVSKHSLNVMAGHDDVYALLSSGYTILFGSNPQEAADLAAIAYKVSALSLIPVANVMDGFATSHMLSEVLMPGRPSRTTLRRKTWPGRGSPMTNCSPANSRSLWCALTCAVKPAAARPARAACARVS